jgi:hypothetical protein
MTATATRQVEAEVLRPESAGAPGVLLLGGKYYDVASEPGGYWLEALSSGKVYHVRVAGGRPVGCDCPARRYRAGECKHFDAARAVLAAW